MSWPFPCLPACRLHALDVCSRGRLAADTSTLARQPGGFGNRRPASPDYPTQQRKSTEKAEGKIKGGGTSWLAGVVCTGGLGGTPPRR
jgi:hypothetical protein